MEKLKAVSKNFLYTWGKSQCALIICEYKNERVYIATEFSQNKGPSITNDAFNLWKSVESKYGSGRFIEHYNSYFSYGSDDKKEDSYAEVMMGDESVSWAPLVNDQDLLDGLTSSYKSYWSRKLSVFDFAYHPPEQTQCQ